MIVWIRVCSESKLFFVVKRSSAKLFCSLGSEETVRNFFEKVQFMQSDRLISEGQLFGAKGQEKLITIEDIDVRKAFVFGVENGEFI